MESNRKIAEAQLLGALLYREGSGMEGLPFSADDFLIPLHRAVWESMGELMEQGKSIALDTVYVQAKAKASEVDSLCNTVCSGRNLLHFSRRLSEIVFAEKERMVQDRLAVSIKGDGDPLEAAKVAAQEIDEIRAHYLPETLEPEFDAAATELFHQLRTGEQPPVLFTGVPWFDGIMKGWKAGEQCIIAARPSCGKTDLAIQLMMSLANRGVKSCFFSIEMTAQALLERVLAVITGEDVNKVFRATKPNPLTKEAILGAEAQARAIVRHIDLYTRRVSSLSAILPVLRRSASRGAKVMFLDYLQLMSGEGRSRNEEIERISRGIREAVKELGIPSVLLAQINRASEKDNRTPRLIDLKDSGAIEQDADSVLLLHRQKAGDTLGILAKGRSVGRGMIKLHHTGATHQFYELEEEQ